MTIKPERNNCYEMHGLQGRNDKRFYLLCLIIVKNVPCIKCEQCGEAYFTDDVAARLDEIVKSVSGLMTEIAIIDYSDKAA